MGSYDDKLAKVEFNGIINKPKTSASGGKFTVNYS
jgi:hypothetical protein